MKKHIHILSGAALLFGLLCSCAKDDDFSKAPAVPPVQSVAIDFSDFYGQKTVSGSNPVLAFVRNDVLSNWNLLFSTKLTVPIKGYELAVQSEPSCQDDGSWVWAANYTEDDIVYQVSLIGKNGRGRINWRLEVSSDIFGGGKSFLWISGWSEKDGSAGEWDMVVDNKDTDTIYTTEWKASAGEISSVKATYRLKHAVFGISPLFYLSTLEFNASASEAPYTSSLVSHFFNAEEDFWDVEVEWNKETLLGRVKSVKKFKDSDWHNWD